MTIVFEMENVQAWLARYEVVIDADTDTTVAVPAGATACVLATDSEFWIDDSVITLPTLNTFVETTALKNPEIISVDGITTLHFRSRNSQDIHVTFYTL